MPVISVVFDDIEIHKERFETVGKVENNVKIEDVREEKINDEKYLGFIFKFTTFYYSHSGEKIASIILGGRAIYKDKDKVMKNILRTWEKDKKIEKDKMTEVTNVILMRSQVEAIVAAKEVNLPSPVPLPRITPSNVPKEIG